MTDIDADMRPLDTPLGWSGGVVPGPHRAAQCRPLSPDGLPRPRHGLADCLAQLAVGGRAATGCLKQSTPSVGLGATRPSRLASFAPLPVATAPPDATATVS